MSRTQTQSPNPTGATSPSPAPARVPQRASIPISVYRELANELQATEEQLNALKSENQQLLQQNRRLRQEATRLFLTAQQMQQLIASSDEYGNPLPVVAPTPEKDDSETAPALPSVSPQNWVVEVEERASRRPSSVRGSSEISAWVLATAVGLIILTALGLGFLAMRFVMNSKNR